LLAFGATGYLSVREAEVFGVDLIWAGRAQMPGDPAVACARDPVKL
jgi:hypothetical protein